MRQNSGNTSTDCSAVWHVQNGRSRVQRICAAGGFRTEYPYTGVVVVAENCSTDEDLSASLAVETVRDVFAEGVAFGVEDALADSFDEASELIREKNLSGCSAAAVAFSATHIWYALAGNCRIYRIDSDGVRCIVQDKSRASESKMSSEHPEYLKKVRSMEWWLGAPSEGKAVFGHTRIRKDTTYLIMTSGSWVQFESGSPMLSRKGGRRSLHGWITALARELKLAYRRQGGALAAVSGRKARADSSISWKSLSITVAAVALAAYLIFGNPFSCSEISTERSDLFSTDSVPEEIVQPLSLETDTIPEENSSSFFELLSDSMHTTLQDTISTVLPDFADQLPLESVVIGLDADSLPADSFAVSRNTEPDIQWENYSPGIYCISSDSVSVYLAATAARFYPHLEIFRLDRIITVRENGVSESARWLSSLAVEQASLTGVIVETRSSVAGGANWIRNYPVFANGNRDDRSGEPGGFMGDSLPGIPVLRNEHGYRLILVQ